MKKSLTPLGETEMEVLNIVWQKGEATVADVREEILNRRDVAYTTIMTVMKNLYKKEYLTYRKEGVTYVYKAAKEPDSVKMSLLGNIMTKVFGDSPLELVQTLVKKEDLSKEELQQIKQLIDRMEE